jgi:hypothetical protein
MTITQIDLLSGMFQALLTADEVDAALGGGLGLADWGRQVIPAGSSQRTGFLCPEGQAILDPLGSAYDPQVSVRFSPPGDAGFSAWVSQSLLYEPAEQNAADFATLMSAVEACVGAEPWETPEGGPYRIERLDVPAMGDASFAVRVTMGEGGDEPWLEVRGIGILIGPALIEVSANAIHGAPDAIAISDGGLEAIARAALEKIEPGLAESADITVEPADVESINIVAGLLAGLLTTEEIGGGWADEGRMIVPTEAQGQGFDSGLVCPEGLAIGEPVGSALDRLVFTSYRREGSPVITESLMWGHEAALSEAFDTAATALGACFDREPWDTEEMGTLRMHALDLPSLGTRSIAYYVGPGTTPGSDPWAEFQILSILVTGLDPSNDLAVVINLEVLTVHDPVDVGVEMLDHEELARVAQAAVDRWEYDG